MTAGTEQQSMHPLAALLGGIDLHGEALDNAPLFDLAVMAADMSPADEVDNLPGKFHLHAAHQAFGNDDRFSDRRAAVLIVHGCGLQIEPSCRNGAKPSTQIFVSAMNRYYFVKLRGREEQLTVARDSYEALDRLGIPAFALINLEHMHSVPIYREGDPE
jgi:hypothetical protein